MYLLSLTTRKRRIKETPKLRERLKEIGKLEYKNNLQSSSNKSNRFVIQCLGINGRAEPGSTPLQNSALIVFNKQPKKAIYSITPVFLSMFTEFSKC